jgi:AcrR family transcriptional regulator
MKDPLTEVVLRSTVLPAAEDPIVPVPTESVAAALSPAAARIRPTVIDVARRLLVSDGPLITLAQVSDRSAISEVAIRTQFPTIEALLDALVLDQIEQLIAELAHRDLRQALEFAAKALSEHPLLEAFGDGPAQVVLARMARVDVRSAGWQIAAQAVEAALARAGRRGSPMVLRWLASYLCAPATAIDIAADVDVLVAGLPPLPAESGWTTRRTG